MDNNSDEYLVKDLYEASFLYAKEIKLLGLRDAGKYLWFVFENKKECESLANDYWSGNATVNAKKLTDAKQKKQAKVVKNQIQLEL